MQNHLKGQEVTSNSNFSEGSHGKTYILPAFFFPVFLSSEPPPTIEELLTGREHKCE